MESRVKKEPEPASRAKRVTRSEILRGIRDAHPLRMTPTGFADADLTHGWLAARTLTPAIQVSNGGWWENGEWI